MIMHMKKQTSPFHYILVLAVSIGSCYLSPAQIIQDETPQDRYYMRKARVTNFWEMKDFRDVFHVDKYLMGRQRFSGNIAYNWQRVLLSDEGPKKLTYA